MNDKLKRRFILARRRQRRFRYRRLHFLRLDVVAVVFLFVVGWLLCPRFKEGETSAATGIQTTSAIIEQGGARADMLVLSPAVFAFTMPGGFADGVVAAGLAATTEDLALLPPLPAQSEPVLWPQDRQPSRWPGGPALWNLSLPPASGIQTGRGAAKPGNFGAGVETWVSKSGVRVPEGFATDLNSGRGKTLRIYVMFGPDGSAENVVLGQNLLDPTDAATLEQRAMQLSGPPSQFAWITIAIP